MSEHQVFSIGHSTHPIEKFLELLRLHGVTALADVRSAPYSRFNPQFNREELDRVLKQNGIAYVFLGKELGARSNDRSCYENGRVQYRRLAQTEIFKAGIQRIRTGVESHNIALMCAEKEPLECHRTLLVSRELEVVGTSVTHILGDGRIEAHKDSIKRLLKLAGLPDEDMFRSQQELIADAYAIQEERVAYTDEKMAKDEQGVAL